MIFQSMIKKVVKFFEIRDLKVTTNLNNSSCWTY